MNGKLLRFDDLKSRNIVKNWPTLLRWIEREGFPAGMSLGPNSRAWRETDIDAWLASRDLRKPSRSTSEAA
jgi:predicted DNA-binding transcriptional regulator AlpA